MKPRQPDLLGEPAPAKPRKSTIAHSLVDHFEQKWFQKFGEKYNVLAQDHVTMKRLAETHGDELVRHRIDEYLEWDDRMAIDAGYPVWGLNRWWVRLAATIQREKKAPSRARKFCDRYAELYRQHRNGAQYLRQANDIVRAEELCCTWDDQRLERLAVVFLKTDHEFAMSGSRTIGQFAVLASWCDDRLREVEAKRR